MSTLSKPPLLNLPAELRNKIWGNVLVSQSHAPCLSRNADICDPEREEALSQQEGSKFAETNPPALFFVCRQLYNEARSIYYGENPAKFVFNSQGYGITIDTVCGRITTQCGFQRIPLEALQQVVILVEILTEDDVGDIRSSLRRTGSRFPFLRHLTVLLKIGERVHSSCTQVLKHLAALRALHVSTYGVLPVYSEYLKSVIQGNEPKDRLSRMYMALQGYAPVDWAESQLQKACDAMENADLEGFTRTRQGVVSRVRCLRGISEEGLYRYDERE